MIPGARHLSKTKWLTSPWAVRGLLLLGVLVFTWTVLDGLRTGSIRAGRGIWHRTVYRDNDPVEFWFAVFGNSVGFVVVLSILVLTLVERQWLSP
jgi:hypothetical protein